MKKFKLISLIFFLLVVGCAGIQQARDDLNNYKQTVSTWTSYKDVEQWFIENFEYDHGRFLLWRNHGISGGLQNPEDLFKTKTGVCTGAAFFVHETLWKINPKYKPRPNYFQFSNARGDDHYVCSFRLDGKLYIMDYGVPRGHRRFGGRGTHGPFDKLSDYKKFVEEHAGQKIESMFYVTLYRGKW